MRLLLFIIIMNEISLPKYKGFEMTAQLILMNLPKKDIYNLLVLPKFL